MDTQREPAISGPMFPHGQHDRESLPQLRLRGTIIGTRPGRRGEEVAQVITIKLEDWAYNPQKLLNTEVDLLLHPRS